MAAVTVHYRCTVLAHRAERTPHHRDLVLTLHLTPEQAIHPATLRRIARRLREDAGRRRETPDCVSIHEAKWHDAQGAPQRVALEYHATTDAAAMHHRRKRGIFRA